MKKLKKRKGYSEIKLERVPPLFNIDKASYEQWVAQLKQNPLGMASQEFWRFGLETPKETHDKKFAKSFKREVLGEEEKE